MKIHLQLSVGAEVKRMAHQCARRRGKSISVLVEEHFRALDIADKRFGVLPPRRTVGTLETAKPRR